MRCLLFVVILVWLVIFEDGFFYFLIMNEKIFFFLFVKNEVYCVDIYSYLFYGVNVIVLDLVYVVKFCKIQ